ncbi:MAG TPA: hypothetical protein VGL99_27840 [Chloroflexota bacterium]
MLALGELLLEPTEPVLVEAAGELVELPLGPVPIEVLGDDPKLLLELLNPP